MKSFNKNNKYLLVFVMVIFTISCETDNKNVILYVNSYHRGYPPSDSVEIAIISNLSSKDYRLHIAHMDSKRNNSSDFIKNKIDSINDLVRETDPDVMIVSDDNAVKYLVKPYYNDRSIPVVFCGVNWSADQYDLNTNHITGMLEIIPLKKCIQVLLESNENIKRIAILSEKSTSEENNKTLLDTLYRNCGIDPMYFFAENFTQWKEFFLEANEVADLIYLPTNGAVKGWKQTEAESFVHSKIKKPIITCDDFMMRYACFGLTKVPVEQGIWAAEAAKRILSGDSPNSIPITQNQQWQAWINEKLMDKIVVEIDEEWIQNSIKINEKNQHE